MTLETCPQNQRIKSIRPHCNRTMWLNYKKEECVPICVGCGEKINRGDLAYYCILNPIRLRVNQNQAKVCVECGEAILRKNDN